MDPVTALGLVACFLLALGFALTKLETACDNPRCAEVHREHRRREAAEANAERLAQEHRIGWHDRRTYQGCPLCRSDQ